MTRFVLDGGTGVDGVRVQLTHLSDRWRVDHGAYTWVFKNPVEARHCFDAELGFHGHIGPSLIRNRARLLRKTEDVITTLAGLVAVDRLYFDNQGRALIAHNQPVGLRAYTKSGLIRWDLPGRIQRTELGTEALGYALHRILIGEYPSDMALIEDTLNGWSCPTQLRGFLPAPEDLTPLGWVAVWDRLVYGVVSPEACDATGQSLPALHRAIGDM